MKQKIVIGIDVGGTNTDVVVVKISQNHPIVIEKHKVPSQQHFVLSISKALTAINYNGTISSIMVGTTFFLNSLIQRKNISKICLIRLCGRSAQSVLPYCNWPSDLKNSIEGISQYDVKGGYYFDGNQINNLDENRIKQIIQKAKQENIKSFAITGVFSPLRKEQQIRVAQLISSEYPEAYISLSYQLANLGFIQRQNATILNATLRPLATETIRNLKNMFPQNMRIFLTQNNGTIVDADICSKWPIKTFASGVTNSMVGASFLTGFKDAVVIDIGGTTTDIGIIKNERPKLKYANINLFDQIRTHMPMPNCRSLAIGGGTIVKQDQIGPQSLGSKFLTQSLSFGGKTLVLTDIWASLNKDKSFGTTKLQLDPQYCKSILRTINQRISQNIQLLLQSSQQIPLIVTGGGSILFDTQQKIPGISKIIKPQNHDVCNAIGAVLCNVSGNIDSIIDMKDFQNHDQMLKKMNQLVFEVCQTNGALKNSINLTDIEQIPITYISNHDKRRLTLTAIGKIDTQRFNQFTLDKEIFSKILKEVPQNLKLQSLNVDFTKKNRQINMKKNKPNFDNQGNWVIDSVDIQYIAFGAGILGSGGGGDAFLWKNWCLETLRLNPESMKVISPKNLKEHDIVLQVAFAGSPAVMIQYLANGDQFKRGIQKMQNKISKKISAVATAQIGGANGLMGLIAASMKNIPVVDIDSLGRAFPKLDNAIQLIYNQPCCPCVISSTEGQTIVFDKEDTTPKELQEFTRSGLMKMGCIVGLCFPPLSKNQVQQYSIHHSLSLAWMIGAAKYNNPCNSIQSIQKATNGRIVVSEAKIISVQRRNIGGFSIGQAIFRAKQIDYYLQFQNQNLLLKQMGQNGKFLAITPEIISIVQQDSGTPITSQLLRYGLIISVLVIPPHYKMTTKKSLTSVGPQGFGIKQIIDMQSLKSQQYPSVWKNQS